MKVSVLITSYNQKGLLQGAVESVLDQTRVPDEIIIADDCSQDGSQDLIRSYATEYPDLIRPILQSQNVGIPGNRNSAYRATTGDLVTYLDGDDRFRPRKIEVDLETLEVNPEADIACANIAYIDPKGRRIGTWCDAEEEVPTGDVATEVLARGFPKGSLFRNEMVKKEKVEKIGFYDTDLPLYEDWELRIRLSKRAHLAYAHEITSEYRKNPQGISRSHAGRHLDACLRIFRKHRSSIESLGTDDRRYVNRQVRPWIGQFAWRAFRDALERRDRPTAWAYLMDAIKFAPQFADVRGIARFFLPQALADVIRTFRR
ncbi:glycosyltransferase family 2 protein [Salinibacter ruber]|uniref:glycosyltransferase family 2 protein n=1 Tax=Salinibacter ruber TaxID=146919 RepID=UPI0021693675|nr:glycosyltransferase family 2 protein [Salinibacter ruber]MCS4185024.1 glycosyltransferase involved in cell wall biosynthesis [Salinibacter ruber]